VKRPPLGLVAPAALLIAIVAAGCGRSRDPDLTDGKALFVAKCGSCHKLGRANTQGVQGPNLDAAFRAGLAAGMKRDTVKGIVRRQIANVRRGSIMPRNLVTGDRAGDVAAYVAFATAKRGQDQGALAQAGKPKTSNKPVNAKGGQLTLDADPSGALAFNTSKANAPAGALELLMVNKAGIQHNIAVKGAGVDKKGPIVSKGGTSKVSVSLKSGKFEFYCSVPGHEAGGMKGTLTVK
jgi:mono/diheme cytochrome c family protein